MSIRFTREERACLLGRSIQARVTARDRRALAGARVLITGAAGSIGSALSREVAACGPRALTLIDRSEGPLFHLERELRLRWPALAIEPHLIDVARPNALRLVCRRAAPRFVYHAAAYKHVTMVERAVCASVEANVIGADEMAAAAAEAGARFVLISSDKAASPTSVMGATKRLAELAVQARASAIFRPAIVRFGNVLGSSGSVLEVMRAAVRSGAPIEITDANATRYFMAVEEAVALTIKAGLRTASSQVFWLEMGQPVRIGELAERLLALERQAGFAPVPIRRIGLRPGEKLTEELHDPALVFRRTTDRRIWAGRHPAIDRDAIRRLLWRLRDAVCDADAVLTLQLLTEGVHGFEPSEQAVADARDLMGPPREAATGGTAA